MNKQILEKFLQKYNIGDIERVKIVSADGQLSVWFSNDSHNLIGYILTNELPFEEGTYCIYQTTALLRLLNILDDEINVEVKKNNNGPFSFVVSDKSNNRFGFALASETAVKDTPIIKKEPKVQFEYAIAPNFIQRFNAAKGALSNSEMFTVQSDGKEGQLIIGDTVINSNNVVLSLGEIPKEYQPRRYSAQHLRDIFQVNKESTSGILRFSNELNGVLEVRFDILGFGTVRYWLMGAK